MSEAGVVSNIPPIGNTYLNSITSVSELQDMIRNEVMNLEEESLPVTYFDNATPTPYPSIDYSTPQLKPSESFYLPLYNPNPHLQYS